MTTRSTKEIVYDAVLELHAASVVVTRETLAEIMDLAMGVIDDRLKVLANEGLIRRVQRGVYVPTQTHPPSRIVSTTMSPCGMITLDVGDQVMKMYPREARSVALMLHGLGLQAGQIAQAASMHDLAAELRGKTHRIESLLRQRKV